eukprot:Hpha_TRINITY_DN3868_c0_g1::TRINITY_DN3868_c0_g1_i1::g.44487::m.44487
MSSRRKNGEKERKGSSGFLPPEGDDHGPGYWALPGMVPGDGKVCSGSESSTPRAGHSSRAASAADTESGVPVGPVPARSAIESLQAIFNGTQSDVELMTHARERLRVALDKFKETMEVELKRALDAADRRKEAHRKDLLQTLQMLQAEAEEMKRRYVPPEDVIGLNVGGRTFTTTRDTLCRERDSVLAVLFDRNALDVGGGLPLDAQGNFFLDRDSRLFAITLNYLRTQTLPDDMPRSDRKLLKAEAEFFGLRSLAELLEEERETRETKYRYAVMTYNNNFVPSSFMGSAPEGIELFYFQDDCYKSFKDMTQVLTDMRGHGWHPVLNIPASNVNGRIVFCKDV